MNEREELKAEIAEQREHLGQVAEELGERLEPAQAAAEATAAPLAWLAKNPGKVVLVAGACSAAAAIGTLLWLRARPFRIALAVLLRRPSLLFR